MTSDHCVVPHKKSQCQIMVLPPRLPRILLTAVVVGAWGAAPARCGPSEPKHSSQIQFIDVGATGWGGFVFAPSTQKLCESHDSHVSLVGDAFGPIAYSVFSLGHDIFSISHWLRAPLSTTKSLYTSLQVSDRQCVTFEYDSRVLAMQHSEH
jgi:hypothetical protein